SLIDSEYLPLVGSINRIISLALKISKNLRLRTLDLLHVAYAASLNKIGVDTLVTADHEFVKAEKFLKENGISLVIIS
ncbi:MAG: hypothetical protein JZD40_05240, partial [Sulfolobus sp.]|nr:hypothetical protein [Sulfolobus sp.]